MSKNYWADRMELDEFLQHDIAAFLDAYTRSGGHDYASEEEINTLLNKSWYQDDVSAALDNKEVSRPFIPLQASYVPIKRVNLFEESASKPKPESQNDVLTEKEKKQQEMRRLELEQKKKERLQKQFPTITLPSGSQYTYEYLKKYVMAIIALEKKDKEMAVSNLEDLHKHYPKNIAVMIRLQEARDLPDRFSSSSTHSSSLPSFPADASHSSADADNLSHDPEDMKRYVAALQAIKNKDKEEAIRLLSDLKKRYAGNAALQLHLVEANNL